ncbi:MAG: T9SS type A sorting domain-containing protein [Bacteroidaceae bacterium]|nr:T9SS type A sorting domain-containing protein [Bacteroidaceae bacterium]
MHNAGSGLQVTAANGSVVRRIPVKAGQKTVQLSTRGLAAGMYVVSTVGADGTQENCKIVVK